MAFCPARYTREDTKIRFVDEKKISFYLPYRCWAPIEKGNLHCKDCAIKVATRTQTTKKYDNGDYNTPIPKSSHIFGGEWYYEQVKRLGEPSKEKLELAMEAVNNEQSLVPPVVEKQKKQRGPRKASQPKDISSPTEVVEKKKRIYKKSETKKILVLPPEDSIPCAVEFCEPIDSINQLVKVEKIITLTKFMHENTMFYRDYESDKLYEMLGPNKKGKYLGRWDIITSQIIKDAPDSDSE